MFNIRHDHYLHSDGQDQTVALLKQLLTGQGKLMATLDDLKAADVAEDAKIDALIQAHKDLKAAVADLTAQVAAAAQDPAKIQELVDAANAKAAAIDAELASVVSPPVVEPVPVDNP